MSFLIKYNEIFYITASEIIAIHMAIMRRYGRRKVYVMKKRIQEIEEHYRNSEGDIFYKAALLLIDIIREKPKPFEDGHKRTGWISIVRFFQKNDYYFFDPAKLSEKDFLEKNLLNHLIKIQQNKIKKVESVRSWLHQLFISFSV
ncbi:MAG: Fic family protein [Candidatus Helarchaeota archaeon]